MTYQLQIIMFSFNKFDNNFLDKQISVQQVLKQKKKHSVSRHNKIRLLYKLLFVYTR